MKNGQLSFFNLPNITLFILLQGFNDLQTEADRLAQRCIISSLSHRFPNVKIIGEEGQLDLLNVLPFNWLKNTKNQEEALYAKLGTKVMPAINEEDVVIWVDPLDGTAEYAKGFLDHVTVLIGIAVDEEAVGGVIHQPFFNAKEEKPGRTIWGIKGVGYGGFDLNTAPDNEFIVTTTRSHSTETVRRALDAMEPSKILQVGGAGFKVLQLLEGKAHAYVFASPGCKKWDTCAPEAVLEACGGALTDIAGNYYKYGPDVSFSNSMGVLATPKKVYHKNLVNKIPIDLKELLKN